MKPVNNTILFELLLSDYFRIYGKADAPSSFVMLLKIIKRCRNTWLFWFRCAQYESWWQPFAKCMYRRKSRQYLIDIPLATEVGYGLYIGHPKCIVINSGTKIGNNVNLSQFLSIGTNHDTPAVIGDNVYVGPMVCIVEDVVIGHSSTIGAGAVVTRDVPDNATVAGSPAHVLNYSDPGRYVGNRYVLQKEIEN